jgi:hypothetical protein
VKTNARRLFDIRILFYRPPWEKCRRFPPWAVGRTLDVTHTYTLVFIGLALLMPVAMVVGFSLMGRVEMVGDFD